jgi:hypothetical protein
VTYASSRDGELTEAPVLSYYRPMNIRGIAILLAGSLEAPRWALDLRGHARTGFVSHVAAKPFTTGRIATQATTWKPIYLCKYCGKVVCHQRSRKLADTLRPRYRLTCRVKVDLSANAHYHNRTASCSGHVVAQLH